MRKVTSQILDQWNSNSISIFNSQRNEEMLENISQITMFQTITNQSALFRNESITLSFPQIQPIIPEMQFLQQEEDDYVQQFLPKISQSNSKISHQESSIYKSQKRSQNLYDGPQKSQLFASEYNNKQLTNNSENQRKQFEDVALSPIQSLIFQNQERKKNLSVQKLPSLNIQNSNYNLALSFEDSNLSIYKKENLENKDQDICQKLWMSGRQTFNTENSKWFEEENLKKDYLKRIKNYESELQNQHYFLMQACYKLEAAQKYQIQHELKQVAEQMSETQKAADNVNQQAVDYKEKTERKKKEKNLQFISQLLVKLEKQLQNPQVQRDEIFYSQTQEFYQYLLDKKQQILSQEENKKTKK